MSHHFVAVSTNADAVAEFGIDTDNMFGFWDWVGGRYSVDSAIGLSLMCAIGPDRFRELLDGFHTIDEHFRTDAARGQRPRAARPARRLVLELLRAPRPTPSSPTPGAGPLPRLPPATGHGEQRQVGRPGAAAGSPRTRGRSSGASRGPTASTPSTNCIHQGTRLIPCDFIGFARPPEPLGDHHDLLMANFFAQPEALAFGQTERRGASRGRARAPGGSPRRSRATTRPTRSWRRR